MAEQETTTTPVRKDDEVQQAHSFPGVATVLDVYGRLSVYTQFVNVQLSQVRNATGGNIS